MDEAGGHLSHFDNLSGQYVMNFRSDKAEIATKQDKVFQFMTGCAGALQVDRELGIGVFACALRYRLGDLDGGSAQVRGESQILSSR